MASLREYRKKIKTVKSTQQITKAMKMVAAARLRRAQSRILQARPFAIEMQELIRDLSARIAATAAAGGPPAPEHPLLKKNVSDRVGLLLVTADKGLCGSFNTNLLRKASEFLRENEGRREVKLFVAGRKGRDFFKRLGYSLAGEYANIFNQLSYSHAEIIAQDLMDAYVKEGLSEVTVIYNEFKSVIQQKLTAFPLLPIAAPEAPNGEHRIDFIYEPSKEKLLAALLPRSVKAQVFRVLLESFAAELGARMAAMDSATKNAGELIGLLTLRLNRTRQAIITREIAELVGGAEALK